MPLDLSSLAQLDQSFMQDTCRIERDPQRHTDDTWDDATGTYTEPASDMDTIYEGECYFWEESGPGEREEGGGESQVSQYMMAIPRDSAAVLEGDKVTCLTSQEDPRLEGQEFRLEDFIVGTFETSRRIHLTKWAPRPSDIEPA